jgi:hypothetical protein
MGNAGTAFNTALGAESHTVDVWIGFSKGTRNQGFLIAPNEMQES